MQDAREPFPLPRFDPPDFKDLTYNQWHEFRNVARANFWRAVIIDRPYTEADADHYAPGRDKLPSANLLVKHGIAVVNVGGLVGILDYVWPQPPKNAKEVSVITVVTGRNNRARLFTVFERLE